MDFRAATLKEREEFYRNEFDFERINEMKFKPQFYAVDLGSKTGISKFPEKKSTLMILPPGISPEELRNQLIKYLPEGVYYDRNIYTDAKAFFRGGKFKKFWEDENYIGQEFCFDVDAENIREVKCEDENCYNDVVREAAKKALEVAQMLRENHGFKEFTFTYSGRGFHVKVHDKGSEKLSFRKRTGINDTLKGMPIDRWVSGGHSKLMRLPFSLHGVVSRVAINLEESELESFDPSSDNRAIPKFLQQ